MVQPSPMGGFSAQHGAPQMWRHGTIIGVTNDLIVVEDRYGARQDCSNGMARAYGIHPRVGDKVIIDRSTGTWSIAAYLYPGHSFQRSWIPSIPAVMPYTVSHHVRGKIVRLGDTIEIHSWGSYAAGSYAWGLAIGETAAVETPPVALSDTDGGHWSLTITLAVNGPQTRYEARLEVTDRSWGPARSWASAGSLEVDWRYPHLLGLSVTGDGNVDGTTMVHMPGEGGQFEQGGTPNPLPVAYPETVGPATTGEGGPHSDDDHADAFSALGHLHDGRYYTEAETDTLLAGKSDTHNHPYASSTHNHDTRYYTETETDNLLAGKSDSSHTHDTRYYTETETDTLLAGKADTHTHPYAAVDHTHDPTAHSHPEYQGIAVHGADATFARPNITGPVRWYGSVQPDNWLDGDSWNDTTTQGDTFALGDIQQWDGVAWTPTDPDVIHDHPFSADTHTHDDLYYTEAEVDTLLAGKSDTHSHPYASDTHDHDADYAPTHSHPYASDAHGHVASEITQDATAQVYESQPLDEVIEDIDVRLNATGTAHTHPYTGYVAHGSNADALRPDVSGAVWWAGSVEPNNWVDGDYWEASSAA